jgi:hypothetical protein
LGTDPAIMADFMEKKQDTKGKGGSMHVFDKEVAL